MYLTKPYPKAAIKPLNSGASSSMVARAAETGEMAAPGHDTNETAKQDNEFASNEMSKMPVLDRDTTVKSEPSDADVADVN